MSSRNPSRKAMRRLAANLGPEDGIDPRLLARQQQGRKGGGRKTSQLCHQVAETIESLLAEQPDDLLRDLTVVDVEPAPDESRLLVTVGPNPAAKPADPIEVIQKLGEASARLRTELASAITRKRTPALDFRYSLPGLSL